MEIHLFSEKLGNNIIYFDIEDYDKIMKHDWYVVKIANKFYVYTGIVNNKKNTTLKMHRLIMDNPLNMDIDHINGNGLDNRKVNLRICSRAQNSRNQGIKKNNTSGYKGVSYRKDRKKWRSYIVLNNKQFNLGHHSTAIEAAKAYDNVAVKYHGEYARLNFAPLS
jgi:hypothetical protein